MNIFIWLLAGHLVGDFVFQSDWIAKNKGRSWEINFYHALLYTSGVWIIFSFSGFLLPISAVLILLVSHFLIDPLKARWGIIKKIWMDQALHILVLILILIII